MRMSEKITDIINAATPGPWRFSKEGMFAHEEILNAEGLLVIDLDTSWGEYSYDTPKSNINYIAAFDPEHVALMESVISGRITPEVLAAYRSARGL